MIYEQEYLLQLLSCTIGCRSPNEPKKNINWQKLKEIAEQQKILPLIYDTVVKLEKSGPDAEMMKKWQDETLFCAYFFTMQNEQFYRIFKAAEEKGVDMLLLKGIVLKDLYPVPELRTMSDCDVIIKKEQLEAVKEVFLSEGYSIAKELETTIDFKKEGYLKFELFYSLFSAVENQKDVDINEWEQVVPVMGEHIVKLSNEKCFVYLMAHLSKHIRHKGAGIRNIADIILFAKKTEMDWQYIIGQMKRLKIEKFFYGVMRAAEKYFDFIIPFDCPEIDQQILEKLIGFMTSYGVYGAIDNIFMYDVRDAKGSKFLQIKNYLKRIFPPTYKLTERYQYAKKIPLLLPIAWVHRLIKVIFVDKFSVSHGIKSMKSASATGTEQIEILKYFGISKKLNEE